MYRLMSIKFLKLQSIKRNAIAGGFGKSNSHQEISTDRFCHLIRPQFSWRTIEKDSQLSSGMRIVPFSVQRTIVRHQSAGGPTNLNTAIRPKKKRRIRPHHAKYVDLLEVYNNTSVERRAKVRHLKAKRLQEFIENKNAGNLANGNQMIPKILEQPTEYQKFDIEDLDVAMIRSGILNEKAVLCFNNETHVKRVIQNPVKFQNILESYTNICEFMEAVEQGQEFEGTFSLEQFKENNFGAINTDESNLIGEALQIEPKKKIQSKLKHRSSYHFNEEQERLARERAIRLNLINYLKVCVSVGLLNRGFSTLMAHRHRSNKSKTNRRIMATIDMYNLLLHGYAGTGNFDRLIQIFTFMKEDGLPFNEQTFAAIFECLGRLEPSNENSAKIREYIEKAKDIGITLNQIMDRSKFIADQRDIALDAIRRIHPNFIPKYSLPNLQYSNELLTDLNEKGLSEANEKRKHHSMLDESKYSNEFLQQCGREQLKVELDGVVIIKSIEDSSKFENTEFCREKLMALEKQWHADICNALKRDLNTLNAQIGSKPCGAMNYYTFLKTLDINQHANILLMEIYRLGESSETFSPTVSQLHRELGFKVQQRYRIEQKKNNGILEKTGEIYRKYCEKWNENDCDDNGRQIWQKLIHESRPTGPSMDIIDTAWPMGILHGIGRFLFNILLRDIKIDSEILRKNKKSKQSNLLPVFYSLFRSQGRVMKEEIKPHPILARLLRSARQQTLKFESNLLPMLCPPQPWSTPYSGGYLLNKCDLIRLPHQAVQQWERINEANPQDMYPALDSLNQLSSIPWRVNTEVLDLIIKVFRDGGSAKLDIPQPPTSLPQMPTLPNHDPNVSNADRAKMFKEKFARRRKQAEMYSLWCDALYRLSLANHYRDKVFWLPHNMDFRGRVYSVPPHLNHLGSDMARSLLVFDQARPLGVDGFSWLKLHCINLTGKQKRSSIQDRLLHCETIMDDILDSADNPLNGRMWWAESDEPWQTLACCIEIAKVHRSPNPENYMSRFPIHQDGSCNGLQHYAALGRDKAGAISVNLTPSDVPQDVYSRVAELVEQSRQKDAEIGLNVAQALEGFVLRKVIKQTVMTTVYGVTRYGARLQIARQLKDIEIFPKEWIWPASTYLTTKTFESLCEMFTSTREIQDWFTECARLIAGGACNKNVEWCTPLGLPVVQPYNRNEHKNFTQNHVRVSDVMSTDMYERPNVMKQKNAFPPNFIHSLDSSHMMLTSLHCRAKGITFVSVHDCFWTHACTVPDMNKICREQFVALHSQPILHDLAKFLIDKYDLSGNSKSKETTDEHSIEKLRGLLTELPKIGKFDLKNVLDSIYFFC